MVFYESWWEAAKCLSPADRSATVEAIVAYGCEGIEPKLSGASKAVFLMAKPLIDANEAKRKAGAKGGRPKKSETQPKTAGKFINFAPSDTDWDDKAYQIMAAQK